VLSGAWRSLAEASESIASLVAVVLIHGPTSSGGVRHHRTTPTRSAQLWCARNVADPVSPRSLAAVLRHCQEELFDRYNVIDEQDLARAVAIGSARTIELRDGKPLPQAMRPR